MIIDTIEHAEAYVYLGESFMEAMRFLKENKDGGLDKDRYGISENAYALVKRYDSKPRENCGYEAHRDYIDVQYVVSGDEYMGWAPKEKLQTVKYIPEKDKYEISGDGELYPLHAGEFMVLFPSDAHAPCIAYGQSVPVEKIILKVRVDGGVK